MLLYVYTSGFLQETLRQIREIPGVKSAECYGGDNVCVVALEQDAPVASVIRSLKGLRYVTSVKQSS